jgi:hypothetical protein
LFVGCWEINGFAIIEIHEGIIVITRNTVVVIVEHWFRLCEILVRVVTGMRALIRVDIVSTDTSPSDSVVGDGWLIFWGCGRVGRTYRGGVHIDYAKTYNLADENNKFNKFMAYQTAQQHPRSLTLQKNYRRSGYVMEDAT